MGAGRRLFMFIVVVAIANGIAIPAAAAKEPQPRSLYPDLQSEKPVDLRVVHHPGNGHTVLRLGTSVSDTGSGPAAIVVDPAYSDCDGDGVADDHVALQRVYEDANADGIFEPAADTAYSDRIAGCKVFHEQHGHWHFTDFSEYSLRSLATTKTRTTAKVSFCLLDSLHPYPGLPGSPGTPVFPGTCGEFDTQGLSVGWADLYGSFLPGQRIDVTGLHRGRYCLTITADPDNHLAESDDGDNARSERLRLDPDSGTVKTLQRPC